MNKIDYAPPFVAVASYWYSFGFAVIPVIPGTAQAAVSSDTWFETLSPERIDNHGRNHPDHEVGFLPGDDVVVFDADSPESLAALLELEEKLGLAASLIVATPRGEDHYFRRAPGTIARGDCR